MSSYVYAIFLSVSIVSISAAPSPLTAKFVSSAVSSKNNTDVERLAKDSLSRPKINHSVSKEILSMNREVEETPGLQPFSPFEAVKNRNDVEDTQSFKNSKKIKLMPESLNQSESLLEKIEESVSEKNTEESHTTGRKEMTPISTFYNHSFATADQNVTQSNKIDETAKNPCSKQDLQNSNTSISGETAYIDFTHPGRSIAVAFQASQQKIHEWMDEPAVSSYIVPALIGASSAVLVIVLCYIVRGVVRGCRSRRRRLRISKITNQLDDGKKLIDCKQDESDTDML